MIVTRPSLFKQIGWKQKFRISISDETNFEILILLAIQGLMIENGLNSLLFKT